MPQHCTFTPFQPSIEAIETGLLVALGKRAGGLAHWRLSRVRAACGAGSGVLILVLRILHCIICARVYERA
eukprot:6183636-Pleurochrysis_carterae.AAC.1